MTPDDIERAAAVLVAAQDGGVPIAGLPVAPADHDEAYAIQEAALAARGAPPAGWKVGATSAAAMATLRTDRPFAGPVLAGHVLDSAAELKRSELPAVMVEGEFVFVMGSDLGPRDEPYTREEVADAVAEVRPAVEVVGNRYEAGLAAGILNNIADNGANSRLVVGLPVGEWAQVDLSACAVAMTIGGETVGRGSGADVMGHPVESLVWLANHLRERGSTLRAGQAVTTGSCTGIAPLPPGTVAVADFGELGTVEVAYSAD